MFLNLYSFYNFPLLIWFNPLVQVDLRFLPWWPGFSISQWIVVGSNLEALSLDVGVIS
jgi:hypothetical protein